MTKLENLVTAQFGVTLAEANYVDTGEQQTLVLAHFLHTNTVTLIFSNTRQVFNTHIQHYKSRTIARVRDSLHRQAQACIRNHCRHFEQCVMCLIMVSTVGTVVVFALTFPFTWFSLLVLHVFAAVSLKCFSVISFKARFCHSLFLNCFYGYSCFDLSQFSERLVRDGIKLNWT
jgi:hypothetical protein